MPADPQQSMGGTGDNRPVRIPLATDIRNRGESSAIDGRLINAYVEKVGEDYWVYKRPGLTRFSSLGSAATGLGVFNWLGDIYAVWGTQLYKNNVALGAVDGSSAYTFSSALGATPRLFLHNGTHAYFYSVTDGLVAVAGGIPANMVPGQAYLDATTYVVTPGATVQGSGLNDLTTWPALNNLIAQIEPDQAMAVAKQLVYVVVFKQWSTEMFYDAGNATGSPLGPVQGQKLNFGIRHAGTLGMISGVILWVNAIREGGMSVMLLDQLSAQPISTPNIDRLLQAANFTSPVYSWTGRVDGHMFYAVTLTSLNLTLVYDLKQQVWQEWTDTNGNFMPIVSSTYSGSVSLLQHASNGIIYSLDTQNGTDAGAMITTDIFTPPWEAGTRKRKVIGRMRVVGDMKAGNTLQIRVSDDDYQTFSNFRAVDMGQRDPFLTACGTFRRRIWHVRHTAPIPGRLVMVLEPEIETGTA